MNYGNLLLQAIVIWLVVTALGSVCYTLIWDAFYIAPEYSDWRPLNDLDGILLLLPFGWFISLLTPASWLIIAGVYLSKRLNTRKPLLCSVLGGLLFSFFWPEIFSEMMGI
jgi:hypothetical protein